MNNNKRVPTALYQCFEVITELTFLAVPQSKRKTISLENKRKLYELLHYLITLTLLIADDLGIEIPDYYNVVRVGGKQKNGNRASVNLTLLNGGQNDE
jgi:hypothetical protein